MWVAHYCAEKTVINLTESGDRIGFSTIETYIYIYIYMHCNKIYNYILPKTKLRNLAPQYFPTSLSVKELWISIRIAPAQSDYSQPINCLPAPPLSHTPWLAKGTTVYTYKPFLELCILNNELYFSTCFLWVISKTKFVILKTKIIRWFEDYLFHFLFCLNW